MAEQMDAIVIDRQDNVATVVKDLRKGDLARTQYGDVVLLQDVQFGHKFALSEIGARQYIVKYGSPIGRATAHIRRGEHVHVHNVEEIVDEIRKAVIESLDLPAGSSRRS